MKLNINDTFNKELPADPHTTNSRRQVLESCFSYVRPKRPSNPSLVHVSAEMLSAIGLSKADEKTDEFLSIFSGRKVVEGTKPYAMCYGGHQFGSWAGQLGDGRAINLMEIEHRNQRWALQLKGAGETPYSRSADGLAVLRSSIREHLCSEAMFHLGVPTTRSLSLCLTGDQVLRDVMYDGNSAFEKGAVVCRVAPSFIRFGNFQIFTARQDIKNLKKLTDYTIKHFFSQIEVGTKNGYIQFFKEVVDKTLDMIIHWQRVGFVHGVMNTDNMSILGLTIDYGPYGWLEGFDLNWTPNTTDAQTKRYGYGKQPEIALWNLVQLGNAIVPLVGETKELESILHSYQDAYHEKFVSMMRQKLGFHVANQDDISIISNLTNLLQASETDMTIFFRNLSKISIRDNNLNEEILKYVDDAFYKPQEIKGDILAAWLAWFDRYLKRISIEDTNDEDRRKSMNQVNPKFVLRNYMAQLAIDKADRGDYGLIDELYQLLKNPYDEQTDQEKWFVKRPEWARHKVGCSMLSCSS